MSRKHHLIDINIKNILYIYINIILIFNYMQYKIEKVIAWINKITYVMAPI